jgi:hypothetical protein
VLVEEIARLRPVIDDGDIVVDRVSPGLRKAERPGPELR